MIKNILLIKISISLLGMLGLASLVPTNMVESPYPPSPIISGLIWAPLETIERKAMGSDNWPITWADDDNLYTAYGDGWGFDPKVPEKLSLGFSKITGLPPDFKGVNIRSPDEQKGDGHSGKKASGMLMVDSILYMWVRNSDNNGNQCQLAWTTDRAKNWTWSNWKFEELGYCVFLNFGKNYAEARDEYVYMYSPNTPNAYIETDELILTRVPKDQITDRSAYEFFKEYDGNNNPVWTNDISQRGPVFHFSGGVNRLDVTYYSALGRYLMTLRSRARGGGLNQFSIYDSAEPWGQWTTIFYTENWDVDPGESQHIPSKWMSSDGKSFYLVFSGNDAFSVRKATLTMAGNSLTNRIFLPLLIFHR
jgi:hypothetical protein